MRQRIKQEASKLDYVYAFLQVKKHYGTLYGSDPEIKKAISDTLDRKGTMITRPMEKLLADPHLLAGWLSINRKNFKMEDGKLVWLRNPLVVLEESYEYLNMTWREGAPAAEVIWIHDRDLLNNALAFYAELREKFGLGKDEFVKLNALLGKEKPQGGYDAATWAKIQEAHFGFEIGNELLGLLLLIAEKTDFFAFKVAVLLVGLGFRSLSMAPSAIPRVKEALRAIRAGDAAALAGRCLDLRMCEEIEALVRDALPPAIASSAGRPASFPQ